MSSSTIREPGIAELVALTKRGNQLKGGILVALVLLLIGLGFVGYKGLGAWTTIKPVIEKSKTVADDLHDLKVSVDQMKTKLAPVGQAAIEKGKQVIEGVNRDELSNEVTQGSKELLEAGKKKLLDKIGKPKN